MILWGKIKDFSIFSILQFLAAYEKTGVLEIQDFEEYGYVYMSGAGWMRYPCSSPMISSVPAWSLPACFRRSSSKSACSVTQKRRIKSRWELCSLNVGIQTERPCRIS